MAKVTRQASGVVSGTMDVSRQTSVERGEGTAASALARRKAAGLRGKKALARANAAKKKTAAKTTRTTRR